MRIGLNLGLLGNIKPGHARLQPRRKEKAEKDFETPMKNAGFPEFAKKSTALVARIMDFTK